MAIKHCVPGLTTGADNGSTESDAWRSLASMNSSAAEGDYVYVKRLSNDAAWSESPLDLSLTPSTTSSFVLEGYRTIPGDGGSGSSFGNFFKLSSQLGVNTGTTVRFFDIEGSPPAQNEFIFGSVGTGWYVMEFCRISNTRTDATVPTLNLDDEGTLYGCVIVAPQNSFAVDVQDAGLVYGCFVDTRATGSEGVRFEMGTLRQQMVVRTCFAGAGTGRGVFGEGDPSTGSKHKLVHSCSFYNYTRFIELPGTPAGDPQSEIMVDNVGWGCTDAVANSGANCAGTWICNNAFGGASGSIYSGWQDLAIMDGRTLTETPFVDAANLDFRLKSTATQCIGTASGNDPWHSGTNIGHLDLGAIQTGGVPVASPSPGVGTVHSPVRSPVAMPVASPVIP